MTFLQKVFPGLVFQLLSYKDVPAKGRHATMRSLGLKLLPTKELVDSLCKVIDRVGKGQSIILAAGDGLLAKQLNILGFDKRREEDERVVKFYAENPDGRALTPYGDNVGKVATLEEAIISDKSTLAIGLFIPSRNEPGSGSYTAPDELEIMSKIWIYIHIGDEMMASFKVELLKEFKHYRATSPALIVWDPKMNPVIDVFVNNDNRPVGWPVQTAEELLHSLSFP